MLQRLEKVRQSLYLSRVINTNKNLYTVLKQLGYQRHIGFTHQLIGQNNMAGTGIGCNLRLIRCCYSQSPRTSGQLLLEQPGRHAGFAMRRQQYFAVVSKTLHPVQVVPDGLLLQHCSG